ncbi:MAG TPA: hypothetical protein VEI94_14180 [Candidatus Bathyarchaeia archaeon]|nr:hypothetical protein [Candidatus Bathyarchaeia archaeon]
MRIDPKDCPGPQPAADGEAAAGHTRKLVKHGPFTVELCDCGLVHLSASFLTLRLDRGSYRELALAITAALRQLDVEPEAVLQ